MDDFETQLFDEEMHRKIWFRALSLTHHEEDAKDLLQDTFLRAIEKKDSFDGNHMDRWLYTICRNIFYDDVRKQSYTMKDGDKSTKQKKKGRRAQNFEILEKLVLLAFRAEILEKRSLLV